jgi:hypothetical protein
MRTEDLVTVECQGGPRHRGRAHGEALRGVIAEKVARWHAAIGEAYGEAADRFLPRFLAATDFAPAIAKHVPDLAEEVRGIAEGAGLPHDTIYAMQLMDEEWWFGKTAGHGHCSSLAVPPGPRRPTLVAQTMDLSCWQDDTQALLKFEENDGSDTYIFTSAGMVGLMGLSGQGLGICVNTLSQLGVDPRGVPVAFVMRGALASGSVEAAAEFLRGVPHASGQNYQLGGRQGVRTFECSAGGAVELVLDGGRSLHTNHPLASRDRRHGKASLEGNKDSLGRLNSLRADLGADRVAEPTRSDVKAALSARREDGAVSIVSAADARLTDPLTLGAVVYEIGDVIELSVAAGPPSIESWRRIELRQS